MLTAETRVHTEHSRTARWCENKDHDWQSSKYMGAGTRRSSLLGSLPLEQTRAMLYMQVLFVAVNDGTVAYLFTKLSTSSPDTLFHYLFYEAIDKESRYTV